ncbi:MAG: hypothetical protein GTO40_21780 [Deltaproteobacteria bacterium]|nr:hypothetical protein [Deltaproteobacteria bacterium]
MFIKTILLGTASALLYFLLFYFEDWILGRSRGFTLDGWFFLLPIFIAFVFSAVHGVFTGKFWELLGVRAKRPVIDRK